MSLIRLLIVEDQRLLLSALGERIAAAHAQCRTIILTTFSSAGYLQRALKAGVAGYLLKNQKAAQLAEIIRRVHGGETVIASELTASCFRDQDPLTDRERQILAEIESGAYRSSKGLADRLTRKVVMRDVFALPHVVQPTLFRPSFKN